MATTNYSTGFDTALLNAIRTGILNNFFIDVYSGARPTNANTAPSGTFLGRITKDGLTGTEGSATNALNFDTAASGTMSKPTADSWIFTGAAAGTMGWARIRANAVDAGTTNTTSVRMDVVVSTTEATGTLAVVNLTSTVGVKIPVTSFTLS